MSLSVLTVDSPRDQRIPNAGADDRLELIERRGDPRRPLSELAWLNRIRLKYGPAVSLIDLSAGGAQIETTSRRLQPGSTVVVEIAGPDGDIAIPSRVLRCYVSGVVPCTTYRGAVEFKRRFEAPTGASPCLDNLTTATLMHEHARIHVALHQLAERQKIGRSGAATPLAERALASALTSIDSSSGRRAGAAFRQQLVQLFSAIAGWIEEGIASGSMNDAIVERVRRLVPVASLTVVHGEELVRLRNPDAIYLDVPSEPDNRVRLLVEFRAQHRLEDWHLQLLKSSAQLIGFVNGLKQRSETLAAEPHHDAEPLRVAVQPRNSEPPQVADRRPSTAPLESNGWQRLVIRYLDGRVLKGYGRQFLPDRGHVQLWSDPNSPAASHVEIPLRQLKAVFFVHDFDGGKKPAEARVAELGRKIVVTFLDGEPLAGTTLNYTSDGPGFYVSPADSDSNNIRVFVVTSAVRQVDFPRARIV